MSIRHFFKSLSDEMRFVITMIVVVVFVSGIIVLLDRYGILNNTAFTSKEEQKEKTVIVSDAEKSAILSSVPKKVMESMKEAARQDPLSTAHLQLSRAPQGTAEYEELKHVIEADAKLKKRPSIKKEQATPNAPLRYIDKSTPRDRSVDAVYLYLVDVGGGIWPRFCVQTVGSGALKPDGIRVVADGKAFQLRSLSFKTDKIGGKTAEYHDAPLTAEAFAALKALATARKATITVSGPDGARTRDVTKEEREGVDRIMETHRALGGTFNYLQPPQLPEAKRSRK